LRGFLAKLIVLAFPDFTLPFDICTDASKIQIGAIIYQKNCPLACYSYKLMDTQT
jgi:RNase H-like domain found in reverse transcriptase